ncbi:hypothetical protein Lalb_Chr24g0401121 [Lupinus albus]|uniref:Uncharacterized protein n=1 Tax=Lupinus albus TaxID=3870 RepID=A0A6A4N4Q1_LUPAL|nr:hypothetical protein Lalb_Chr24g0401121 [Lupinus albus]
MGFPNGFSYKLEIDVATAINNVGFHSIPGQFPFKRTLATTVTGHSPIDDYLEPTPPLTPTLIDLIFTIASLARAFYGYSISSSSKNEHGIGEFRSTLKFVPERVSMRFDLSLVLIFAVGNGGPHSIWENIDGGLSLLSTKQQGHIDWSILSLVPIRRLKHVDLLMIFKLLFAQVAQVVLIKTMTHKESFPKCSS